MAGETVLIVEDRRENIVHLANNVLKPNGYQVITAMDGQRGLKRILADRPDLVVMDLNMPKMDGLEVLGALQERQVDVPVILTTFYGSEHVAEQALRLGAVEYVVKPYKIEDMLAAVERALSRHPASLPPPEPKPEEVMPLTRQVERWMRDMNILTRVGKALVAQLDLDRVCKRTIEAAIYITRADHALLFLHPEGEQDDLHLRARRGPRDPQVHLAEEPIASPTIQRVARTGRALRLANTQRDTTLTDLAQDLLGPIAAAPLRWQGQGQGVLLVARMSGELDLTESDLEWLSGLADYAAIAVRNARAVAERAQQVPAPSPDTEIVREIKQQLDELGDQLESAAGTIHGLVARLDQEKPTER